MELIGYLAAILTFLCFFMRSLHNLRLVAIFSNICFISYALLGIELGVFEHVKPIFLLHSFLLPLNFYRLMQEKSDKLNENGLSCRCQMPDARCQMPDARCQMPDARCQMPDARCQNPSKNGLSFNFIFTN